LTRTPLRRGIVLAFAALALLATTGCAQADPLSEEDRYVIDQLAEIAPRDAKITGEVTDVECWKPSENMLEDEESTFRVLCRLHYDQEGAERYKDMICLGDPSADPVSDYCYLWAFYSDMPVYEDQSGYFAS
jgi:hypothetical protein